MAAAEPNTSQQQLPDERFWVKYSPHHELPVSGAASLLWHVTAVVGMLVLGLVVAWNRPREMPIEAVQLDGEPGGGGTGGTAATAGQPAFVEAAVPANSPRDITAKHAPANPENLRITPADILNDLDRNAEAAREVADMDKRSSESLAKIADIEKRVSNSLRGGGGTPGTGGGSGGGDGPGHGAGVGPGTGTMNQRAKRKLRWTIMFNTGNGHGYLHQLDVLGAMLTFDGPDGSIRIVRDLSKRPVAVERFTEEELQKLNRIRFTDDKQESVESLFRAMGRDEKPKEVHALFPLRFETELLQKELAFRNRSEDSIDETRFQILMLGNRRYEVVVVDQRYK